MEEILTHFVTISFKEKNTENLNKSSGEFWESNVLDVENPIVFE